ncbi:MAG TPA: group II intron reverse transcriptase/maturase [Edaphobacter sp.]|nr:group II intron reverse transcriptase/maturase [Edaphobacter sp.]
MLYAKARNEPDTRFTALYKYLTRRHWVEEALDRILRNKGSRTAGIDGVTRNTLREGNERAKLVDSIQEELATHTYHPQPARRVYIPKPNGKKRPLGIPTLKDRVVQQLVRMVIEPIFEARFLPCSYGFRPNRCTWDALAEAYYFLYASRSYTIVIEGDIQNCFGTINHTRLMHELRRSLADKRLLALLWQMLRAGVLEDFQYSETNTGTPQGGIVSPLLANVYMHSLDAWFHTRFHAVDQHTRYKRQHNGELAYVRYIRYADDFVVLLRSTEEQAATLKQELTAYIHHELQMTLSEEKTLITKVTDGFDFLGVRTLVAPRRSNPAQLMPYQIPAQKSVEAFKRRIRELTHRRLDYLPLTDRIRTLNWLIEGWANYHRWGNAKRTFSALSNWSIKKVHRMLRRYTPAGKRTTYETHFRPIAECANLGKWYRYTNWLTPSIQVEKDYRLGILPMAVISTGCYWTYRGAKIPGAFDLQGTASVGRPRTTDFYTADEVIALAEVIPQKNEEYTSLYLLRRREVFWRDHYTCTECGYKSQRKRGDVHDLECHHIDPDGGHVLENLKTVCNTCHHHLTAMQVGRTS